MSTELLGLLCATQPRWDRLSLADWDRLLRVARHHNLLAKLAERLSDSLDQLPSEVQPHIVSALRLYAHQREAIRWECEHLADALQALGLPLVLLKGAAYALAGQAPATGRLFGDIDLLVPRERLGEVESALIIEGWSSRGADPYDERYYRTWMHELPPLTHQGRGTVVDVHHNILPLTAHQVPDAQALLAASVPIEGTPFRRLSLEDQIVHSAVHLYHEGEPHNGLRDLFDLRALLGELAGEADWARLLARAATLRLNWPLLLALRHLQALLGLAVPVPVMQQLTAQAGLPAWRLRWLDAVYRRALSPQLPGEGGAPRALAFAWLYLRGHALRMSPGLLLLHLGRKAWLRLYKHSSRST